MSNIIMPGQQKPKKVKKIIKVGSFTKVDPEEEMHLGHQFEKDDGRRSIEKRCDYCGKWFCFDVKQVFEWGNNVKISFNGVPEKVHCGSAHCCDYHHRVIKHQRKVKKDMIDTNERLFNKLKKKGLLA